MAPFQKVGPSAEEKDVDAFSSRMSFEKDDNVHLDVSKLPPRPPAAKKPKDVAREKFDHAGRTLKKFAKFIGPG